MKIFLVSVLTVIFACSIEENNSRGMFVIKRKAALQAFYYARYLFTHPDYEDVTAAVRIETSRGLPVSMEVKDISPTADRDLEVLTLRASGRGNVFTGSSEVEGGGEYRVRLDDQGKCCGDSIIFIPQIDSTVIFSGKREAHLSAEEWDTLVNTQMPDDPENNAEPGDSDDNGEQGTDTEEPADDVEEPSALTLSPAELGSKKVGELFELTATNGPSSATVRLRAYDSSDKRVPRGVARWSGLNENIYDLSFELVDGQGTFVSLFITTQGLSTRTLASFIDDARQGEAKITATANSRQRLKVVEQSSGDAALTFTYTSEEWVAQKNKGLEAMIVDVNGKVVDVGNGTFSPFRYATDSNGETVTQIHAYLHGEDGFLRCASGYKAFVRIDGDDMVYQDDC